MHPSITCKNISRGQLQRDVKSEVDPIVKTKFKGKYAIIVVVAMRGWGVLGGKGRLTLCIMWITS